MFFSIFRAIEGTGLSIWIRESDSIFSFWLILSVHAIGMGVAVGASVLIGLGILGLAPDLPLASLKRFFRFIWVGFWIQVVSGSLLLIGYPTKALTNPLFYVKLTLIGLATASMQMLRNRGFADSSLNEAGMIAKGRIFAVWSLMFWVAAVTAGRLLAYTYTVLTAD